MLDSHSIGFLQRTGRLLVGLGFSSLLILMSPETKAADWPMWGGAPGRNMVSLEKGIPSEWEIDSPKSVKWKVQLGSPTYGNPIVADGRVFIGTNNEAELRKGITGDKGILACFDEQSGRFLWHASHDKLPSGNINDWKLQGIPSAPCVEGDRLYYVSNRCELVCADVQGFLDGENDGPYKVEKHTDKQDADVVWILDMYKDLKVFPHNLATCSPTLAGDLLLVTTSNGVDESHKKVPHPDAPSLLAVNKNTGKIVWQCAEPGNAILHGQWSSPAYGVIAGKPLVIFGAGDGWCYAREAKTGKLVWKFDLNPKNAKWIVGGRGTRNSIIATPVIYGDRVFLASGQDPDHGDGDGHLYCIDATKTGDITVSGRVWHVGGEDFRRSLSTVAVADGLLYAADLNGFFYCFDAATGKRHWKHDTFAGIWASPTIVDGKVMIGTQDGEILVFKHSATKKLLATNDVRDGIFTGVVAANGTLFVTTRHTLFAIRGTTATKPADPSRAPSSTSPPKPSTETSLKSSSKPSNESSPKPPSKTSSRSDAWPMFRGNAALTGVAEGALPVPLHVSWKRNIGEPVVSTAAIVENQVFLGSAEGSLYSLNLSDGKTNWTYKTEWVSDSINGEPSTTTLADDILPAIHSSPLVDDNAVYFGDEDGVFHAVNKLTGKRLWSFRTNAEIISSANLSGKGIVFGSYDGHLYCLDRSKGKLLWKVETESPIHGTPGIEGDRVVIVGCDAKLHILNAATGSEVKVIDAGARAAASPVIAQKTVFLGTLGNQVLAIDIVTGKTRWSYQNPDRQFPYHASAALTDTAVFVGGRDKTLHAINRQSGSVLWTFRAKGRIDSSPVVIGDRVFFGSADGNLYALNTQTGKPVWRFEAGGPISASPAIAQNRLVIGTEEGMVYCFGAERSQSPKAP